MQDVSQDIPYFTWIPHILPVLFLSKVIKSAIKATSLTRIRGDSLSVDNDEGKKEEKRREWISFWRMSCSFACVSCSTCFMSCFKSRERSKWTRKKSKEVFKEREECVVPSKGFWIKWAHFLVLCEERSQTRQHYHIFIVVLNSSKTWGIQKEITWMNTANKKRERITVNHSRFPFVSQATLSSHYYY